MAYDADSLVELQRDARARQKQAAAIRPAYELIIPKIEMLVGAWHVDEYGNQAREIRARWSRGRSSMPKFVIWAVLAAFGFVAAITALNIYTPKTVMVCRRDCGISVWPGTANREGAPEVGCMPRWPYSF